MNPEQILSAWQQWFSGGTPPGFPSMQGSLQEGWTKALEQFQNFDAAELGLPAGQGAPAQ